MSAVADDRGAFPRPSGAGTRRPRFVQPPLEDEADELLRARKRAPVRRSHWVMRLLRTNPGRALLAFILLAVVATLVFAWLGIRSFLEHDPRFRIDSSASIQTVGNSQLTRAELLSVFGGDIGRNVFFVPLAARQAALEQVPWVEHATVMRLLPDQLRVAIVERQPVAFARIGTKVELVDADGVLLHLAPGAMAERRYSFPVVTGLDPAALPAVRAGRMRLYTQFVQDLDSSGEHVSGELSEVDLSDPEDVRAVIPAQGSDILLHFGQEQFSERYRSYRAHLAEWRQQYPKLASVDLRYDREVVLKMQDGTTDAANADAQPALQSAPTAAPAARPSPHAAAKKSPSHHATYSVAHPLSYFKQHPEGGAR
jgi:cell division protein FtsQ